MTITTQQAVEAINKAMAKGQEIGVPANIVVLDTAGYLKSFQRMDDAYLGSIDIAIGKAKTAMLFRMNSEEVGAFLDPAQKTFGMVATNGGLVGFKGGMPIRSGNEILAYIGVSGGSPDQDFEIATAGSTLA
jgi:uncharacterized protein GlcG (DUF336 family)